jgi:1-deoxy-D-xylulose-5-phosphate synthase
MMIMAPSDENECRQMLYTGYVHDGPATVRYPRGSGPGVPIVQEMTALPIGKGEVKRDGRRVAILAFGSMVPTALEVGQELDATVVNMRFVKPLDDALVAEMAARHDLVVTLEENALMGGAGSAVAESLAAAGIVVPMLMLGLPDRFVDHGDQNLLLASVGLDRAGVAAAITGRLDALRRRAAA